MLHAVSTQEVMYVRYWLVIWQHVFQDELSSPLRWLKVFQSFLHFICHLSGNCITDKPKTLNQLQDVTAHLRVWRHTSQHTSLQYFCCTSITTVGNGEHYKITVCLYSSPIVAECPSADIRSAHLQWGVSPLLRTGTHHTTGTGDPQQNTAARTTRNPETQTACCHMIVCTI